MKTIFIGGCDRSGTTLLGSMLGASPGVVCTPESQFKTEILEKGSPEQLLRYPKSALRFILRHWRFSLWDLSLDRLRVLASEGIESYETLFEGLVCQYGHLHLLKPDLRKPMIWVDHTPSNIRYLNRLFSLFQETLAIHIVRDGRAVAASVMPLDWGPNTAYFAAKWWAQKLAPGLAAEHFFGPEKVLRVRYEDLLAEPEAELKRICRFAGIQYAEEMSRGTGFRVPHYTAGQHSRLLTGKIDRRRATGWRGMLTHRQIALFEFAAGDLLSFLGYDLQHNWPASPSKAMLAREGAVELFCRLRNYRRTFIRRQKSVRK